jgi:hypothetical protein
MGGKIRGAHAVLLVALIPLFLNWPWASRSGDYSARDWAYNLLMSVEPYGVLFTNGDNDTFPLWYLQEVEGIRQDVTVIVTSYLNIDWYALQLKELTSPCEDGERPLDDRTRIICQRPYTPEGSPGAQYVGAEGADAARASGRVPLLMGSSPRPPTRSILDLDEVTIRQAAQQVVPIMEDEVLELGPGLFARMPGGMYMEPWHRFALFIIRTSLGDRPIYFASSGNAAAYLGLTQYLIRHGLAFKLHDTLPDAAALETVTELPPSAFTNVTGTFLDHQRTEALANEVFIHRNGLPDEWPRWPWRAVLGIPSYYSWVHYALYEWSAVVEDRDNAAYHLERAEAWARLRIIG